MNSPTEAKRGRGRPTGPKGYECACPHCQLVVCTLHIYPRCAGCHRWFINWEHPNAATAVEEFHRDRAAIYTERGLPVPTIEEVWGRR
jgi:hypothetical protein